MRSLMRDASVTKQKLPPGTLRRIMSFAAPYRRMLGVFLGLIVVDALIGVWNPLIYRQIIDGGIAKHDSRLIVVLALLLGGWRSPTPCCRSRQRYISSRVGEGLIYDMREKVFGHVQEMPLGVLLAHPDRALISRLNNDVLGAQQAFTDTLVVDRQQPHHRHLDRRGDGLSLLADNRRRLAAAPAVRLPGAPHRPQAAAADARGLQPERADEQHHDRALQRLGCPVGQALRPS